MSVADAEPAEGEPTLETLAGHTDKWDGAMVTMISDLPWQFTTLPLDPATGPEAVRTLASGATASDGVAPLSEHSLLHLTSPLSRHLFAYAGEQLVGSALWEAATEAGADRGWAHGDLPGAAGLAAAYGLERVRELHRMTRVLTADDRTDVTLDRKS